MEEKQVIIRPLPKKEVFSIVFEDIFNVKLETFDPNRVYNWLKTGYLGRDELVCIGGNDNSRNKIRLIYDLMQEGFMPLSYELQDNEGNTIDCWIVFDFESQIQSNQVLQKYGIKINPYNPYGD